MEESDQEEQLKKIITQVKTFSAQSTVGEIKENFTINTHTPA